VRAAAPRSLTALSCPPVTVKPLIDAGPADVGMLTMGSVLSHVPHFSGRLSLPPTDGSGVGAGRDSEQVEQLFLERAELWGEGLDEAVVGVEEPVAGDAGEGLDHAGRAR
jgi:hypothetical protein